MKYSYLIVFCIFVPTFITATAQPQAQTTQASTTSTAQPNMQAQQEDETAALVLLAWGKLAGNMVNIIKDPNNVANVAANVGQLFAGFAGIIGQIVKRDGKNNLGNVMAMLESQQAQQWLIKEITKKPQ